MFPPNTRNFDPMLAPEGAAGGATGDAAGAAPPAATSNTPERFTLGGRIVTAAEAEKMLKDASAATEQLAKLQKDDGVWRQFFTATQKMIQNSDANAFRAVAKAVGVPDAHIEQAASRFGASGKAAAGDDDGDDEGTSPQIAALQAKIDSLTKYVEGLGGSVTGQFETELARQVNDAVNTDDLLGKAIKHRGDKLPGAVRRIRDAAIAEARRQAKASGGLTPEVISSAVAKARELADAFGYLNPAETEGTPTVGAPQSLAAGLRATFGTKDPSKLKPDPMADTFKQDLGALVAGVLSDSAGAVS